MDINKSQLNTILQMLNSKGGGDLCLAVEIIESLPLTNTQIKYLFRNTKIASLIKILDYKRESKIIRTDLWN